MMKEGDVILTPVPQADGTIKTRPAVILREMPPYKDFLVCGVSTQLHQQVKDFDEVISPSDPDLSGLATFFVPAIVKTSLDSPTPGDVS